MTAMAQPRTGSGIGRVFEHRWLQYRRTYRATIFSSFLTPVLFLGAMGLGLGIVRRRRNGRGLARRRVVPRVPRARAARRDVHAVRRVRVGLPDDGRPALVADLPRHVRGTDQRTGRGPRQPRLDRRPDAPRRDRCSRWSSSPSARPCRRCIVLAIPVGALTGLAFAAPIMAFCATQKTPERFNAVFRFGITPLFLFSGTFYPVESLPAIVQPLAWITPLWHGVVLARGLSLGTIGGRARSWPSIHLAILFGFVIVGTVLAVRTVTPRAGARMSAFPLTSGLLIGSRRSLRLIERNLYVYKHGWLVILSGFFEPLFYLLSIGFGLGALVGDIPGPGGEPIPYQLFVAPALLASAAMNGAISESTFNFFFKLNYNKTFTSILSTPLSPGDVAVGELAWALIRGGLYAIGFMVVMVVLGLVVSPWVVLAVPAALLVGFAFGAVGMAATSFMRTWQDFDLIQLVILPMFLFSATFFPLETYPPALQVVVQLTPLYQGVDLIRSLTVGAISPILLVHVAYLTIMGFIGLWVVSRRLDKLLLK